MQTIVIIHTRFPGRFTADVQGQFGGGFSGANAGKDAESAAIFAAQQMCRYGSHNPDGAVLVAPQDVLAKVPEHLRQIEPRSGDLLGKRIACS